MIQKISAILILQLLIIMSIFTVISYAEEAASEIPQWPDTWILMDTDPAENSDSDDYRDVQFAYFNTDDNYLYFRLECYGYPNFSVDPKARYKWFIDIDDPQNMNLQGGTVYEAEYLLFVEDSPKPGGNGIGDIYLLNDTNDDGLAGNDWSDYYSTPGPITDENISGFRIEDKCIDMYIKLDEISSPLLSYFTWATDQEDPNLDSAPSIDRSNDYWDLDLSKADITIIKNDSIDPVNSGATFEYILLITNNGPQIAENINITDILPGNVTFISANPSPNGINEQTLWWLIPTLNIDEQYTITINVSTNETFQGNLTNTAQAYSTTYDPTLINNIATEKTTVINIADLSITKSDNLADSDIIPAGRNINYTIQVTNNGPNIAESINITDILPANATIIDVIPTPNGIQNQTIWWLIPTLNIDEQYTITINVSTNETFEGNLTNTAQAYSTTYDPDLTNNIAKENTTVQCFADLEINKNVKNNTENDLILSGSNITYIIQIKNNGPHTAHNLNITDILPTEATFLSANPHPNGINNKTLWWNIDSLENNGSLIINVNVTINNETIGIISNRAEITNLIYDPDMSNNNVTVNTLITGIANLHLYKSSIYEEPLESGSSIIYLLNLSNSGPQSATNVIVYDSLPDKLTFVNASPIPSGNNGSTYWWNFSTINVSEHIIIQINTTINAGVTGSIINQAYVIDDSYDPDEDDNEDDDIIIIEDDDTPTGGGGGGSSGGSTTNPSTPSDSDKEPTADANGPYYGTTDESVQFDGSASHDNDEDGLSIVRFDWRFSDDEIWINDTGVSPTYFYNKAGVYTVTLRVFDDEGNTDTNTTMVTITHLNNPPSTPIITGPENGTVNTEIEFDVVSDDDDNDTIQYTIDWGDNNSNTSGYVPPGTHYKFSHIWTKPGIYTITVIAEDNETVTTEEFVIEIDEPDTGGLDFATVLFIVLPLLAFILLLIILFDKRRKEKKKVHGK